MLGPLQGITLRGGAIFVQAQKLIFICLQGISEAQDEQLISRCLPQSGGVAA